MAHFGVNIRYFRIVYAVNSMNTRSGLDYNGPRGRENPDFLKNIDFDWSKAYTNHDFYEHLKLSRGHYGHLAPDSFS